MPYRQEKTAHISILHGVHETPARISSHVQKIREKKAKKDASQSMAASSLLQRAVRAYGTRLVSSHLGTLPVGDSQHKLKFYVLFPRGRIAFSAETTFMGTSLRYPAPTSRVTLSIGNLFHKNPHPPIRKNAHMVAIDFGHQSNPGRDSQISAARLVNAYMESQSDGKSQHPVLCLPGLTRWDGASATYEDYVARGIHVVTGKGLYAVLGNKLVRFIDATAYEGVGTIAGASEYSTADGYGYVGMASNMASEPYLGIITEDGLYYYFNTVTGVLTLYEGEDLPAPKSITFLDRYFVFAIADGRIFHTEVGGTDVNPLSFAYAESRADGLQNVIAHRGALVVLGDKSLEIWENVGTSPFAFAPIRADIGIGCMAGQTVVQIKEGVAWVDQYGLVQYMRGSEPEPIGTAPLVRAIEALSDTQRATLRACHYQFSDNSIYSLTSDVWTWEYNAKTKMWHEHQSRNASNWRGRVAAEFDNKTIIAERDTGYLYYINTSTYTEDGDYYTVIAQGPPQHLFPSGGTVNAVFVDAVRGVGRTAGDADAQAPQLMLDWSVDGGKTWIGGERASLGAAGEYSTRITFRRLGRFGENGISFRLACSSSVMRAIMATDVQFSPLHVGGGGQVNEQGR